MQRWTHSRPFGQAYGPALHMPTSASLRWNVTFNPAVVNLAKRNVTY
ncbi:hypothetical protein D2E25_1670 [Bifidobacterium goeldii]|uniref:Uncharacterized protein n=1 Tax=Bifidobacterium goeldii TaxID=2306975 RepID=A0A430FFM0_9BIFI|nr:hypothetical protein D2E25_1670 [Bifidobacterium goeldii]